ncbi:MAG TPA: ABC transporter substrate-binding protein [Burkholderiales bacterium]|nr:ABC transporter substrate-binding protein [Burkholderiales bacterium]
MPRALKHAASARRCAVLLAVLALAAAPDAGARQGKAPASGTLRVAINSDMRSTQFGVNRDGNTDSILHHVVEGLVAYRDNLAVGPLLAKKWEVSRDARAYTFTLRDGAVFHNGKPVTAADVKWSWERLLRPETGFACRNWFDGSGNTGIEIEKIEAVSDSVVRFTLKVPNALFLTRMAHIPCLSGIIHKDSVDASGKWIAPIATGPYTIRDWRRDQYVELARFDRYKPLAAARDGYAGDRSSTIERLRFVVIGDAAAAKAALLAGDIDVLLNLDLDAVDEVGRRKDIRLTKNVTPGWQVLMINNRDPLLRDKRVRQAIARAIDRRQVVMSATHSLGSANPSAVAAGSLFHGKEFDDALPHSREAARKLLSEAGYRGEPVKIQTSTQYPQDFKSAIMIQGMLRQVGLNAELEVLDWATHLKNYFEGRYQLMTMGFSARADPAMLMDVFIGDKGRRRSVVFDDPGVSALLRESGKVTDAAQRRRLFGEIHKRVIDDSSIVGLFNQIEINAAGRRVQGFASWALGKPRFWGVELVQ